MLTGRTDAGSAALRWGALTLGVALLALPFLGKAFHIDDPFFLRISQNVLSDPLDPFAGVIDWGGARRPVWELASNPPLLSYYLAPWLAIGNGSEIVLHLAVLPFLLLLAASTHWLGARFTGWPWLAVLLVMTSPAVVVGSNLMRDVPATALGSCAVALVIAGTDRRRTGLVCAGFAIAGLAVLTRFNALVFVGAAVLYPLLAGRLRTLAWGLIPLAMLAAYGVHNILVYGEPQLFAQLGRGHNRPLHAWRDNLAAICVVLGSISFLAPALLLRAISQRSTDRQRSAVALGGAALACAVVAWGVQSHLGGSADAQYWLWSLSGAALLGLIASDALRPGHAAGSSQRDPTFLGVWLFAQGLLAVVAAPYPAVRHLLPALLPVCLLGLRFWERGGSPRLAPILIVIALQLGVTGAVAEADRALADSYRDFAAQVSKQPEAERSWFVGQWGWLYYAERAGLRQLHEAGEAPQVGDRLIVPTNMDAGVALLRRPELAARLRPIGTRDYTTSSPFRSVSRDGAGYYALFSGRNTGRRADVPYRWLPGSPIERFTVYEVGVERGGR